VPKKAKARLGFLPAPPAIQPGDTLTLPTGEVVEVADAQDAAAINKHIGSDIDDMDDMDDEETWEADDDSDLIDEDPED
jgi:cell division protein FtsX